MRCHCCGSSDGVLQVLPLREMALGGGRGTGPGLGCEGRGAHRGYFRGRTAQGQRLHVQEGQGADTQKPDMQGGCEHEDSGMGKGFWDRVGTLTPGGGSELGPSGQGRRRRLAPPTSAWAQPWPVCLQLWDLCKMTPLSLRPLEPPSLVPSDGGSRSCLWVGMPLWQCECTLACDTLRRSPN